MKKKLWILGLTTALIGCSVGGGMLMDVSEAAAEEGSGVTIGTFYADAGYVLNGTSSDVTVSKTTLSYKWDAAA